MTVLFRLLVLALVLLLPAHGWAAAPTLLDYQESNCGDGDGVLETTGSITYSTGNFIVALGATADNPIVMATPLRTGETFNAVASTPTNTASRTKNYAWTATAANTSSGTVTSVVTGDLEGTACLAVWVYSGSDGLGNTSISTALGATTVQSLTRGFDNSAVVQMWGDWNAINDTTVTSSPAGGATQRVANNSANATFFALDWTDQSTAGATSYGFTGHAGGGQMTAIALEIKGTVAAGPSVTPFYKRRTQ
jgi:hypothetical protein